MSVSSDNVPVDSVTASHEEWWCARERERLLGELAEIEAAKPFDAKVFEKIGSDLLANAKAAASARQDRIRLESRRRWRTLQMLLAGCVFGLLVAGQISVLLAKPREPSDATSISLSTTTWNDCLRGVLEGTAASSPARSNGILRESDFDQPLEKRRSSCAQAQVSVSTRGVRAHPEQAEITTSWRFPSAAELEAQATAQRAMDAWLRDENKESANARIWKTVASFLVALSVFGLMVGLSILLAEALRQVGYEWDFSEFAKRALEKEAAAKSSAAATIGLVLVAIVPMIAIISAAIAFGVAAMHRMEPPDLNQLAPFVSPGLERMSQRDALRDSSKETSTEIIREKSSSSEGSASGARNYDAAFDALNDQLQKQGLALAAAEKDVTAGAAAASAALQSQRDAANKLAETFTGVAGSASTAASQTEAAANAFHDAASETIRKVHEESVRTTRDEKLVSTHGETINRQTRVLCNHARQIDLLDQHRVADGMGVTYPATPSSPASGVAARAAPMNPCDNAGVDLIPR